MCRNRGKCRSRSMEGRTPSSALRREREPSDGLPSFHRILFAPSRAIPDGGVRANALPRKEGIRSPKFCDPNHIFLRQPRKTGVKSPCSASPCREADVTHKRPCATIFPSGGFAWKIGPLSFLLPSSPPFQPNSMKAAEPGFLPRMASVDWLCSASWRTFSRTSSRTSFWAGWRADLPIRGRSRSVSRGVRIFEFALTTSGGLL